MKHDTIRRIRELRNHTCVISTWTNDCWQCRALKRYRADAEMRKERGKGGGRYRKARKA